MFIFFKFVGVNIQDYKDQTPFKPGRAVPGFVQGSYPASFVILSYEMGVTSSINSDLYVYMLQNLDSVWSYKKQRNIRLLRPIRFPAESMMEMLSLEKQAQLVV